MNNEQLKFDKLENPLNLTPIEKIIEDEQPIIIEETPENIFLIEEEPPAPKKETRGRPKKPIEKKEVINNTILGDDEENEFISDNEPKQPLNASHISAAQLIPTEAVLLMFDKGMSILFPFVLNKIAGTKLKTDDFKLTAEEKKQLREPLENCMKELKINISNPFVILGITALAIYGGKAANVLDVTGAEVKKADGRGRPRKNG
jgi:hypothetical protein